MLIYSQSVVGAAGDTAGNGGLVVRGLRKRFEDIQALDGVDLHVGRGELVGFLGPNGAGKTTTMRSILGLLALDEGEIWWDGHPISKEDRRHIGYMPQERGLYMRMKVHEQISYIGRLAGVEASLASKRADEWIERVGLAERRDDDIQELSVGNQQRVQLAVALVHEPDLLVMDEPFAGLDPVAVATLSDVMKERVEQGTSVVFSSHQLELVQDMCDVVTIVAAGNTKATGAVSELRAASDRRILEVLWSAHSPVPEWAPAGAEALDARPGVSRFSLPADTDPMAVTGQAHAAGDVVGLRFEPPGLEQVFIDLVSA